MDGKIIFSRTYDKAKDADILDNHEIASPVNSNASLLPWNNFYEQFNENTSFVVMPQRLSMRREFVNAAIEVAEHYSIDVVITEYDERITADLSFDCGSAMKLIKRVISYADDISFFCGIRGREITLSVDFYTHAVFRSGKKLAP